MKVIQKKKVEKQDPVFAQLMRQELEALEKLDHPHIVRVLDLCEDENNIYIAAELLKHGNLLEFLDKMKQKGVKFTE